MSCLRTTPWGVACLLWCAAALAAAPAPPLAPPVSSDTSATAALHGAVRALWQRSPDVQAAAAELAAARARADAAAQPYYNPELSLEAENADVDRRVVGISMALDVSGKRRARGERGDAQRRVAEAAFDMARREVAARWLKALVAVAQAAHQSELGQQRLDLLRRFDQLAAQRLRLGDLSRPERDLAALALTDAHIQQATLEGDIAAARASLMAVDGSLNLAALPTLPTDLPPAAGAISPRLPAQLPALIKARGELAAAEAGVDVARRARIPDPVLSLAGGEVRSGRIRDNVVGVSVSIPLPMRNNGGAEVQAARAEVGAANARLRADEHRAHASLLEARLRYVALRNAAGAFRDSRTVALDERAALLEKLWRAGEIGTSDYLLQLRQGLDTALSGSELERRVWQGWFDYLAAAGRLVDWLEGDAQELSR